MQRVDPFVGRNDSPDRSTNCLGGIRVVANARCQHVYWRSNLDLPFLISRM